MERDLWKLIVAALRRLPRRWRRNAVYCDAQILAVLFWAALHDRPIVWACRRRNWPPQAWRRVLPDQSTLSRRLRDPSMKTCIMDVLRVLQEQHGVSDRLVVDAKALSVSEYSTDRDARTGWGAGCYMKGYKLHVLIDAKWRVLAWRVRPMNEAESVVACDLVRDAASAQVLPTKVIMLGDAAYDSNPLYGIASTHGVRLIAPRRKPNRGVRAPRNHPQRLESIALTEQGDPSIRATLGRMRDTVERFFGALASVGGGLAALPPWARRQHRSELWSGAKLAINAARITQRRRLAA